MPQALKKQWKPNKNSKLEYITYEQNIQLCDWLTVAGFTYAQVREKVKKDWNLEVSVPVLQEFYKKHVLPYLIELRQRAVHMALGYSDEIGRHPGHFSKVTMDALEQKAMQACWDKSVSAKELKVYLELLLRWQEQQIRGQEVALKLRRLEMLERRHRKLEAAFTNAKLTNEDVAERCRTIFKQNGEIDVPTLIEKTPETGREKADLPS